MIYKLIFYLYDIKSSDQNRAIFLSFQNLNSNVNCLTIFRFSISRNYVDDKSIATSRNLSDDIESKSCLFIQ